MKTLKKNKFLLAILFAVFAAATAAICLGLPSIKSARAESLVQETFVMEDGVSAKLSLGGGVRFRVKMDSVTKDNILNDSEAELQIIVAPESYFDSNVAETNSVKITVDKQKIYKGENDDFYYANGCITDIKVDNRTLNLKAIAKIVKGTEEVGKTAVNDLAVGNMRDVLVSAVLDASGDYEKTIAIMPAYSWFGTEDYPITITSLNDYNALVKKINGGATEFDGKFATYSEAFKNMEGATALESGKTAPKGIYSVILESNGGSVDTLNKYVEGTAVTLPTPTKTGHNFMGWFISSAFDGEPVTEISAGDYGDKTFFAKWEAKTYTVTLNANEATECGELTAYTYGTAATLPVPTKTGHDFMGWFDNAEFAGDAVTRISATETGDKTFFAKWEAKTYTVTLNANEATECGELTAYTYGAGATLPVPTKTGYNFTGWFDNAEFAGDAVTQISATDMGDKTFYAKWEIITYQVKFLNADGSVLQSSEADYGTVPEYAGTPTIASNRYVYTFNGWNKELTAVTGEQLYIATYTKASKEAYSCTYSSAHTDYSFEETATADDGVEWNVTMEATKNFYHNGGVKLVSTTGDYITITNAPDAEKTIYTQYNGDLTKGYVENKGYAKGGGEGAFTMTFKFAKVNGKIYCYADGRLIGSYSSTEAAGMFSEGAVLTASTFRGNADTEVLKFTVTLDKTFAIAGNTENTNEFSVTATGNFTFTATIQGTGLYTEAGIRVKCGDDFINIYSHTYNGNNTNFNFDGWNYPTPGGWAIVNLQNSDKAVYKVVKTDEKMSFYLNDILVFEFDKTYHLALDWGNRFFKEGAVFSFGLYTKAGAGGTGYACDVNIDYAN